MKYLRATSQPFVASFPTASRSRATANGFRWNLLRLPLVKFALTSRWPQLILQTIALAGFIFAIVAGLIGTPVGSRNFGVVFVWIGWWALLILVAVPLLGRGWCAVCPIPLPGEWLKREAVLGPHPHPDLATTPPSLRRSGRRRGGEGRRWPSRLRNMWLQNAAFLLVALFSLVILTRPLVSAVVLAALLVVAVAVSLVFERRAFCRYLCPVGGFIGLYSQLAPVEVRVKDTAVCAAHTEKTCYTGSAAGYGCSWQVFPGGLVKNTYCGLCLECLRTCPYDNVAINLRPFGADLLAPSGRKLDEAFKAFIMLGSAIAYSAVMLGPWGWLKSAAYSVGTAGWWIYAVAFLVFVLGLLPGGFFLAILMGQGMEGREYTKTQGREDTKLCCLCVSVSSRLRVLSTSGRPFISSSYALIPLGLAAWIAFTLSFALANMSYLFSALSDPMGWGWNLFGTASMEWMPYLSGLVPALQVFVLLVGLLWSSSTALRIAEQVWPDSDLSGRRALPSLAFLLFVTLALMVLLV